MSKTKLYIHIVFATKNRYATISMLHKQNLYNYIHGIMDNLNCECIKIGGTHDHVHILVNLRASLALSELVKNIKQSSTIWMKGNPNFPKFDRWQEGYFAGSVGPDGVKRCKKYIENQEQHHLGNSYLSEIEWMINKYELTWYKDEWV